MTNAYTPIKHLPFDERFYEEELKAFLPEDIFDIHLHIWRREHEPDGPDDAMGWAGRIEAQNPIEMVKRDYETMLSGKNVRAMPFGWVSRVTKVEENNQYVGQIVRENPGWHGLAVTKPEWDEEKIVQQVEGNGLKGMKPYVTYAPAVKKGSEITIYDILSPKQLKLADVRGYVIMLHLPHPDRIRAESNIRQMLEIEEKYPNVKLIVAHIGRAFCVDNLGDALKRLSTTRNMCFDFSGNTNQEVIRQALDTFGSERILFGSDLPLTHIHMHREHVGENYINQIPMGEREELMKYPHMERLPEDKMATYYLYESLAGFVGAAKALKLTREQIYNVMCGNALRILEKE